MIPHRLALLGLIVPLTVAVACSGADVVTPPGDPFTGSYTLTTVARIAVPGTVLIDTVTGGSTLIRSGSIQFLDLGHLVFTQVSESKATGASPTVSFSRVDTFAIGRLPTEAFVLDRFVANDTVAVVTVPSSGRLAWDFLGVGNFGTYTFSR